jgi:hypothetical protein
MIHRLSELIWFVIAFWYFSRSLNLIFLNTHYAVLWGIAITSAFIFLVSSRWLMVTSLYPTWVGRMTGAIAAIGALLITGCLAMAPGIALSVAAGVLYLGAGILVIAMIYPGTSPNQQTQNSRFWCVLTVIGLVGLAILFCFSCIGPFSLLFLPFISGLIVAVVLSLSRVLRANSLSPQAILILAPMILLGLIVLFSGMTLRDSAVNWSVEIIQLGFATVAAALVSAYLNKINPAHQAAAQNQRRYNRFLEIGSVVGLIIILGFGIQGYSDFLVKEAVPQERLSSITSPTFLQNILYTKLWNVTVTISPDAQFLAIGGHTLKSTQEETVQLWNLKTRELIQQFPGDVSAFSNDRSGSPVLITRLDNSPIKVWNLSSQKLQVPTPQDEVSLQRYEQEHTQPISLPAFVPQDGIFWLYRSNYAIWDKIMRKSLLDKGLQ